MIRRWWAVTIILILCLSLCGCGVVRGFMEERDAARDDGDSYADEFFDQGDETDNIDSVEINDQLVSEESQEDMTVSSPSQTDVASATSTSSSRSMVSSAAPAPTSSAAPRPPASSASAGPASTPSSAAPEPQGQMVYRTPYGKRYHYDPECGGKNSYSITMDQALKQGLTPCQKCVHD